MAPLAGDVLRGDLYVRGGGDPHLVIEDLWLLVNRLRGFGIRDIRGDLVLDKTLFEPLAHDPGRVRWRRRPRLQRRARCAAGELQVHRPDLRARHRRARWRVSWSCPKSRA